jgi:quercetin dioxygenase-like cupin family protein
MASRGPEGAEVDQDAIARRWGERGFSCGLWIDPPGQVWEDFVHPVDELVLVVEGEVEFEVAGVVHRPGAGEELLIPAGAHHTVRTSRAGGSRWLYGYGRGSEPVRWRRSARA